MTFYDYVQSRHADDPNDALRRLAEIMSDDPSFPGNDMADPKADYELMKRVLTSEEFHLLPAFKDAWAAYAAQENRFGLRAAALDWSDGKIRFRGNRASEAKTSCAVNQQDLELIRAVFAILLDDAKAQPATAIADPSYLSHCVAIPMEKMLSILGADGATGATAESLAASVLYSLGVHVGNVAMAGTSLYPVLSLGGHDGATDAIVVGSPYLNRLIAQSMDVDPSDRCPVCGTPIDQDDVDLNANDEDGYGWMSADCDCASCGAELAAWYEASDGYSFSHFEVR